MEYPGWNEELFYDKAGNRTGRVAGGAEERYYYDKRNRLTAQEKNGVHTEFQYDDAENLVKDEKAFYTYDAFNRNTRVETFDGNIQINRYDAEGLRHEMEENGKLVQFIFRGTEVVAEETQEEKIRYTRAGELLASDAESARTYYHYASDEMGSITHVTAGNEILNRYEYDAWGNAEVCEEQVANRFRFNGQQYDPVSQQYYLRARFYNPVIARFTQEDTYRGDGLNLYAYCKNNPVYYVDPSGHICEKRANEIMGKLAAGGILSNSEGKKLAAYLRNKERRGGITDAERQVLGQVDRKKAAKGSKSDRDLDAWKAIDEYRSRTNGLEPLGDTIPTKGDNNGTVAFVEVNGNKVFGVNSSLLSDADKDLGRKYFAEMKQAGYFENVDIYGRGSGQVFTHAEGYSLMKAYSIYGDDIGNNVTIYCDRSTCGICQNNLQYFKEYLGLEKLTVKNKNGNIFEY